MRDNSNVDPYDCDTDEEMEQIPKSDSVIEEDPYDVDTDIDEDQIEKLLPDTSNMNYEMTHYSELEYTLLNYPCCLDLTSKAHPMGNFPNLKSTQS